MATRKAGSVNSVNSVNSASAEARAPDSPISPFELLQRLCARHDSIDALLEDAAEIALALLGAEICAIAWLDEDKPERYFI